MYTGSHTHLFPYLGKEVVSVKGVTVLLCQLLTSPSLGHIARVRVVAGHKISRKVHTVPTSHLRIPS